MKDKVESILKQKEYLHVDPFVLGLDTKIYTPGLRQELNLVRGTNKNQKETKMKETSTRLFAYPRCYHDMSHEAGRLVMEFDESGWKVVEDTRCDKALGGYLHIGIEEDGDISAKEITEKVRNNMVKYFYYHDSIVFNNPQKLPALGATPQQQYMSELSLDEREEIGNRGNKAFYA